jgi:UDP-galactopyranose mutase
MKEHDLVCFSHLRWNFVFQRPQHLLTRFSKHNRVFYIEEPMYVGGDDHNQINVIQENLFIIVPHLGHGITNENRAERLKVLVESLFKEKDINKYIFWYYTPMSLEFTQSFSPDLVVYDCMDELSAFKFAPQSLKDYEQKLFEKADLVFTGGYSLYEAKKHRHDHIFPFPSSIDKAHFSQARTHTTDPSDQASIPHPRLGFYGVIDERMDIDLIGQVAKSRPDWHFVIIGPVVKIDPGLLPRYDNIHYLGNKSYQELPTYLGGWDIALIPFAINESTRFISPTKTPEYLAAGKPVISSSIQDVIKPYGENHLVHIADNPEQFIQAAELEMQTSDKQPWLQSVDTFLHDISWDSTWKQMMQHINDKLEGNEQKKKIKNLNLKEYVYV